MVSFPELMSDSFDTIEKNFSNSRPFIEGSKSSDNQIKCLTYSMEKYYEFVTQKITNKENNYLDIKEHLYSMYLKAIIKRLESCIKKEEKSGSKEKLTKTSDSSLIKEEEINSVQEILDSLANSNEFFLRFSKIMNYFSLDVSIFNLI